MEFKFSLFEIQENLICSSFFKEYGSMTRG